MIVGGGPNGVETAGFLSDYFKNYKKIGIVNKGPRLLPNLP